MLKRAQEANSDSSKVGELVPYGTLESLGMVPGQYPAGNIPPGAPIAITLHQLTSSSQLTNTHRTPWCLCKNQRARAAGVSRHLYSHWNNPGCRPTVPPPASPLVRRRSEPRIRWWMRRGAPARGLPRQQTIVKPYKAINQVQATRSASPAGRQPHPSARRHPPFPGHADGHVTGQETVSIQNYYSGLSARSDDRFLNLYHVAGWPFFWSAFTFDWFDTTGLNFLTQTGRTFISRC